MAFNRILLLTLVIGCAFAMPNLNTEEDLAGSEDSDAVVYRHSRQFGYGGYPGGGYGGGFGGSNAVASAGTSNFGGGGFSPFGGGFQASNAFANAGSSSFGGRK